MPEPVPIPLLRPSLPSLGEVIPYLEQIEKNGRYTNFGPLLLEFENRLAEVVAAPVCLLSNGTTALEVALHCLNLPAGSGVLLPSLTFPATASAVLRVGLRPVLADCDESTWQLTTEIAHHALRSVSFAAVIPVATFGRPINPCVWDDFFLKTGKPVVIDAAGAFGGQKIGQFASACFSLHATKSLAVGEGGFFASNQPEWLKNVCAASNFGFENGLVQRWGTNAKMSEFHAAVGLAALAQWPTSLALRIRCLQAYESIFSRLSDQWALPDDHFHWPRSTFVVQSRRGLPPSFFQYFANDHIETRRWYFPPLHRHPAFKTFAYGPMPITDRIAENLIGLPFFPTLTEEEFIRIECVLQQCDS